MSRVILTISYEVVHEKRDEYLKFMRDVKAYIQEKTKCEYSVFELLGRKNWFSEIYVFENKEEYDKFDEVEDNQMDDLLEKLNNDFVKDGKVKPTQMIEMI